MDQHEKSTSIKPREQILRERNRGPPGEAGPGVTEHEAQLHRVVDLPLEHVPEEQLVDLADPAAGCAVPGRRPSGWASPTGGNLFLGWDNCC